MIEKFRKVPIEVETILWDGTPERAQQIKEWVGKRDTHEPRFLLPEDITGVWNEANVWNDQEHCWIPCPVGHRVVKGLLGEFYPISPEAVEKTYEAVQ